MPSNTPVAPALHAQHLQTAPLADFEWTADAVLSAPLLIKHRNVMASLGRSLSCSPSPPLTGLTLCGHCPDQALLPGCTLFNQSPFPGLPEWGDQGEQMNLGLKYSASAIACGHLGPVLSGLGGVRLPQHALSSL